MSALTIYMLKELRRRPRGAISSPSVLKSIWEGWQFLGQTQVVRGILLGMTGAFAAGGVVVGLGPSYVRDTLQGGSAGWGAVWAAIFFGLAIGMFLGPRVLESLSRRRLFGLSIASAAVPLALIALIPNLAVTIVLTVLLGACAGAAYVTGYTVIGLEVDDYAKKRPFAFLQSTIRVILFAVIAIASPLAGAFNALAHAAHITTLRIGGDVYRNLGYNLVLLAAAVVAVLLGRVSYRQMDDRKGVPLWADLASVFRGRPQQAPLGDRRGCRRLSSLSIGPACSSRWRAARAQASRPRPGCLRSGCVTRASTWLPRTSPVPRRSACGSVRCSWIMPTSASRRGLRR